MRYGELDVAVCWLLCYVSTSAVPLVTSKPETVFPKEDNDGEKRPQADIDRSIETRGFRMSAEMIKKLAEVFATARECEKKKIKAYTDFLNYLSRSLFKDWNPEQILWAEVSGPRGLYQRAEQSRNQDSEDFQLMAEDVRAHGGTMRKDGYFYWVFDMSKKLTVGRKRAT